MRVLATSIVVVLSTTFLPSDARGQSTNVVVDPCMTVFFIGSTLAVSLPEACVNEVRTWVEEEKKWREWMVEFPNRGRQGMWFRPQPPKWYVTLCWEYTDSTYDPRASFCAALADFRRYNWLHYYVGPQPEKIVHSRQ